MNSDICKNVKAGLLPALALLIFATGAPAQKRDGIKPPPSTASLAEIQGWLVGTIGKYASYKTRVTNGKLSNVKFDGCTLGYTETRTSGSISTATMGTTRTTNAAKDETSIDLTKVKPDGISLEDHIYPELQTIKISMSGSDLTQGSANDRLVEIVVKREAADAIKTALMQIARLCSPKN